MTAKHYECWGCKKSFDRSGVIMIDVWNDTGVYYCFACLEWGSLAWERCQGKFIGLRLKERRVAKGR